MRRHSSRHVPHQLNELNVTPLLDLAFVLLIIFVIATQSLEYGLNLSLPEGGQPDRNLKPEIVRTIEVDPGGRYLYQTQPVTIDLMEQKLVEDFKSNTNLVVFLRVDKDASAESLFRVTDMCTRNQIYRFSWRAKPLDQP
jgi:biopolymer transport protein ExbD